MRMRRSSMLALVGAVLATRAVTSAAPVGTAFTYQGQIEDAGGPITDTCDFEFSLWNAEVAGLEVGSSPQSVNGVSVEDGLFSVSIDFDTGAFNGEARWLGIKVCCPSPGCSLETLDPRVPLTPAPHALALPGFYTTPVSFGVTDGINVVGGYHTNGVDADIIGATISGGGSSGYWNVVADHYGTIGGGEGNYAGGQWSTVAGGGGCYATEISATAGGGFWSSASGAYSTVAGGSRNQAIGQYASIPGGEENRAGGDWSLAAGRYAEVRSAATVGDADGDEGTFVWADSTYDAWNNRFTSTGPNQFLISAAGGVGIGTNSPAVPLHVTGGTDTTVSDGGELVLGNLTGDNISMDSNEIMARNNGAADTLSLNADGGDVALMANGPGNVGIGTSSPAVALHIDRGDDSLIYLGRNPQLSFVRDVANDKFRIQLAGSGYGTRVLHIGREDEGHDIVMTGKVGIGRSASANKLEVEGDASKTTAGSWLANSDARIKEDVRRIDGALMTIDRLRPVRFKYTDEYRAKHASIEDVHYVNFVAQEYQEVFPDSVKDSSEDGLLQIDTHPASIYAVAAVQELHHIVKDKDAQIAAQTRQIGELAARLAALEQLMKRMDASQKGGAR